MRQVCCCLAVSICAFTCHSPAAAQPADNAPPVLTTDMLRGLPLRNVAVGFKPGRIADIAVDPRSRSTWYVASASSGLWKTTNRGTTWAPIFDEGGSYSLGVVVVDPRDSNVIWLGTGENQSLRSVSFGDGVYKSIDAGKTWKKVGMADSEHIGKILIDPRDSNTVYVAAQGPLWAPGGDRGLFKTTDGGETWDNVLNISENTGVSDIVFDPRNPDVIFASAYQRRRHVGVLIGGGPEAGILKSTDAGANWKRINEGLPAGDKGRIALAVSPQNPDIMYAWMNSTPNNTMAFYRSADAGNTWVRTANARIQDPQFYGELYADPHHFERVYLMDTRVQVTDDGGQTFRALNWNTHVDHHALTFDPTDANHLLLGNDGGVYETYDGGQTWRSFTNMPMPQFYALAVSNELPFYYIYAGAQDNGTQGAPSRTIHSDGIHTSDWINIGGGDGMQPRVDPEDGNIVYNQSQNGALQRLDKRTGASAGIRPPRGSGPAAVSWNWNSPLVISPHAAKRLYYGGSRLFRSDDRGDNWRAVSPDLTREMDVFAIPVFGRVWDREEDVVSRNTFTTAHGVCNALSESPLVEGLLYFGTDDHLVHVSEDGGENWRKVASFPGVPEEAMVSDLCASAHDNNVVYASFNNYMYGDFKPYLLRSGDRGKNWEPIAGNLPDRHPVWSVVEDPVNKNLLFAGTEFGLFVTIDGGRNWAEIEAGVPAATAFRDLEIQKRENDLIGATFGRGFFILDDYAPLRSLTPQLLAEEGALLPVGEAWLFNEIGYSRAVFGNSSSPNPPFGALITYHLKANAPAGTQIVLQVKDATGRELRRINGRGTAGIHRVAWDLRGPGGGGGRRGGRGGVEEEQELDEELEGLSEEESEELGLERALEEKNQLPGEQGPGQAQQQDQQQDEEAQPEGQRRGGRGARQGRGGGRGARGGRGGGAAPLVQPGVYSVTLNKLVEEQLTPIGQPQEIRVTPLPTAVAPGGVTVVP
jgi:photosystem II stability/assembly factor-like uncharacterized protein